MHKLEGKHAVITGGGRGIGAAIADRLAGAGAKLSLMGRNLDVLEKKCANLPDATAITCDVTDEQSVTAAFDAARAAYGPVDILVNNAGAAVSLPFHKTDVRQLRDMLDVNLVGPFLCIQACLDDMKDGGRIITIASTAALKGYRYVSTYGAAKHAVLGLTRSLALELANKNITVNAVCPGFTKTDIMVDAVKNITEKTGRSEEEAIQKLVKHNPQKRLIEPDEVAATVLWLCDPASKSVTGQAIAVAGGEVM